MGEPAREPVDALHPRLHHALLRALPPRREARHMAQHRRAIGNDQCRRRRRCRRADVGDEIADREIGLVAHRGDHGQRRLVDRLRDGLLVVRPQVLDRAAAPADDQHVDLGARVGGAYRLRDLGGRAGALHRGRVDDHAQRGPAPAQRREQVGQCGGARRGDDAHGAGIRRQRSLAFDREPAGGVEARLEAGILLVEGTESRQPRRLDVELELAARLVDRRGGAHFDLQAVLEREARKLRLVAEEHAAHLRARVLQIEVAVPGRRAREVGYLARHPDEADVAFEQQAHRADEQGDRQHRRAVAGRRIRGNHRHRAATRGRSSRRTIHRYRPIEAFDKIGAGASLSWTA